MGFSFAYNLHTFVLGDLHVLYRLGLIARGGHCDVEFSWINRNRYISLPVGIAVVAFFFWLGHAIHF